MYIDLMEDYWIKNILGNEDYTRPLEIITENVLRLPKGILENQITIKSHEYPIKKATYKEKNIRADVFAFLGKDVILNLEAYKTFNEENLRKSNVYLCRGYSSQLKKSMPYRKMKKFIQINLVDHVKRGVLQDKLVQRYFLEEQGYPLTDDIQIYYIRLDLLDKLNYNEGISDKEFLNILHFLKAKTEDERRKLIKESEVIRKMDEVVKDFLTDEVMNEERSILNKSNRLARETGIKIGRQQGIEQGLEQGLEQGIEQGLKLTAENLLKDNKDVSYISKITGLSIEKIKEISSKELITN